jgi:hypothetical protein
LTFSRDTIPFKAMSLFAEIAVVKRLLSHIDKGCIVHQEYDLKILLNIEQYISIVR